MKYAIVIAMAMIAGCAIGRLVHAEEAAALPREDALLAMSVRSGAITTLSLCRDGDYAQCVTVGPYADVDPVRVYDVPAGRYCLLDVHYEVPGSWSVSIPIDVDRASCVQVEAGTITYPGDAHVVVIEAEQGAGVHVSIAWEVRSDFESRFADAYPTLAGRAIVTSRAR